MQELKLVIQAKSEDEARSIFDDLGIAKSKSLNFVPLGELYVVVVKLKTHLSDDDYAEIEQRKEVSILRDSDSKERSAELLDKIYEIEMRLREMVICTPELTSIFEHILRKEVKYEKYGANEPITGKLDVIVGHLEFGGILEIFKHDLLKDYGQNVPRSILEHELSDANNFDEFKERMLSKFRQQYVWDVVAAAVLKKTVSWGEVEKDLFILKNWRNAAAHFRVITPNAIKGFNEAADRLLVKIELKKELSAADMKEVAKRLDQYLFFVDVNDIASKVAGASSSIGRTAANMADTYFDVENMLVKAAGSCCYSDILNKLILSSNSDVMLRLFSKILQDYSDDEGESTDETNGAVGDTKNK